MKGYLMTSAGIITFHCAYNFGSALQTWALKTQLESLGLQVRTIDYRGKDFEKYELLRTSSLHAFAACIRYWGRNKRRKDSFEAFISTYLSPTDRRFTYRDEDEMGELAGQFDAFVCGSDQIWNLDCTQGPVAPYFLSFAGDRRRVAYAPSLAHASFDGRNFTEEDQERIRTWLGRFDAISVREQETASLFQPLTSEHIETCLDPTLLMDGNEYRTLAASAHVPAVEGTLDDYLFVYMLEVHDGLIAYANKLAAKMHKKIVYVNKWDLSFEAPAVNMYGVGPKEFLALVLGCHAVVTTSFHATVFSLLLNRPFQTFSPGKSGTRMRGLLGALGCEEHLIDGTAVTEPEAVDMDALTGRLEILRGHSLTFLERAMRG